MSNVYVGVDIGGTKITTAVVDESGRILGSATVPSQKPKSDVIDVIWDGIEQGIEGSGHAWPQITAVGLGAPGPVDPDQGMWWGSTNLVVQRPPLPLRDEIEARCARPVFIENDVKAGGLGEYHFGHGRQMNDETGGILFVSVGTGLAGSLLINGRLFRGNRDAGEIGHIPFDPTGHPCACGQRGCLETIAAGRALIRWGREVLDAGWSPRLLELCDGDALRLNGGHVLTAAQEGDRAATVLIERLARGIALAALTGFRAYDPELVVLGGGVIAGGGDFLHSRVESAFQAMTPKYGRGKRIYTTELGANAGVLGAAAVALDGMKQVATGGSY